MNDQTAHEIGLCVCRVGTCECQNKTKDDHCYTHSNGCHLECGMRL